MKREREIIFRLSIALFILFGWLNTPRPANAQTGIQLFDVAASIHFGENVTFQARLESPTPIQAVFLLLEVQGADPVYLPVEMNERGEILYQLDPARYAIRPFAQVNYAYRVEFTSGSPFSSETYRFEYTDNRFDWQQLSKDQLTVYWYGRDIAFGQLALNNAGAGIKSVQGLLPAGLADPIRIYIYASPLELQTVQEGTPTWVAGHAAPDLRIILVSVASGPDEGLEMERQLPHELMHLAQYELIGSAFEKQPYWLIEGTASVAELYPNPEYKRALDKAVQTGKLLPMANLCASFPRDASGAFLAYAQSASFVRYLHGQYGARGLQSLVLHYQDGLSCEKAVTAAFGLTLSQLEYRWQQETLGVNPEGLVARNLFPYFAIAGVLFGMVALSMTVISRRSGKPQAKLI